MRETSPCNTRELKNLATREKLEVWGINSTLGNYQIAVYLWNSGNIVEHCTV